jgi:hypothetical protein
MVIIGMNSKAWQVAPAVLELQKWRSSYSIK